MKKIYIFIFALILMPVIGCIILMANHTKVYSPPKTEEEFLLSVYGNEHVHYIMIPAAEQEFYKGDDILVNISKNSKLGENGYLRFSVANNTSKQILSPLFLRREYAWRLCILLDGTWYYVPPSNKGMTDSFMLPYHLKPYSEVGTYGSWILLAAGEEKSRLPSGHYRLELDTGEGWITLEFLLTDTKRIGDRIYSYEIVDKNKTAGCIIFSELPFL